MLDYVVLKDIYYRILCGWYGVDYEIKWDLLLERVSDN